RRRKSEGARMTMTTTTLEPRALPIDEVTVLEDRALVQRRGTLDLPPGSTTFRLEGVAPALVDKSLSAIVVEPTDVRVLAVRVERRRVTEDHEAPEELALLHARQRELFALLDRVQTEHHGLAAELAMLAEGEARSEEHTSELQSRENLVCRLLLEKKNK